MVIWSLFYLILLQKKISTCSPAFGAFCSKVRSEYDEIFFRQLSKSKNIQETPVTDQKSWGVRFLEATVTLVGGSAITVARILPRL